MIITLKFRPGICANQKNWFFDLKKKIHFLCGALSTKYPLGTKCSKHTQTNEQSFSPIPARTCWDTIFRAQGASDQLQALKLTGVINQKGQSEVPPWDIIYVQNLPGKQGSSNNFLFFFFFSPDTQGPVLWRGGAGKQNRNCTEAAVANGSRPVFTFPT